MKIIKLMADYYCFPLWKNSPGEVGNINPDSLPLSGKLKTELESWAEKYNSILNQDDPITSGFANDEEEKKFIQEGYELAASLQNELGENYKIVYFSDY